MPHVIVKVGQEAVPASVYPKPGQSLESAVSEAFPQSDRFEEANLPALAAITPGYKKLNWAAFPPFFTPEYDLDQLKEQSKNRIDLAAGAQRRRYITAVDGQDLTYQAKAKEAKLYLSDPTGDVWPWLDAEIGSTGGTRLQVATAIAAQEDAWTIIGAAIEGVRVSTKRAVSSATTAAEIAAIEAAVVWPSGG